MARMRTAQMGCKMFHGKRRNHKLRGHTAAAFPAVTPDFEGVNLRRLLTAIFGV